MQFADDVTLVVSDKDVEAATSRMDSALEEFRLYTVGNRLAAEPKKTQMMVCAARRKDVHKQVKCQMGGQDIVPQDVVKVLGVKLDNKLSWEAHSAAAAGKASGHARAVARGMRFLRAEDRAKLIQTVAHPLLEYCQVALEDPSAHAFNTMERAYNRTARIAARLPEGKGCAGNSELARKRVNWPEWEERREAVSQAFVCKIWIHGEPECLRKLLPDDDKRRTGVSRADTRGEIQEPRIRLKIGQKAFRNWGPEAYNEVCRRVKTRPKPQEPDKDTLRGKAGKAPEDTEKLQREGYYAYLKAKYTDKDHRDEDGRKVVWTDGSAVNGSEGRKAGAGVFHGLGNENNRIVAVDGPQTNQRAELTAVLHCLENIKEPLHVRTDSSYVKLGIETQMRNWKAKAWYKSPAMCKEIDHADLWQRVDNLICQRTPGDFKISWIKGHGMPRHVKMGQTTELDIWGNNEADALAGRASAGFG